MPKVWGSILKGFPSFLIDLSVSAQGSSIPKTKLSNYGYISEPVGGSAPKFSEKSSGFVLTEKSANPFSLACPAQGSPTPGFGSVDQLIFLKFETSDQFMTLEVGTSRDFILTHVYSGNAWLWNVGQLFDLVLAQVEHLKMGGYNQVQIKSIL